jgi:plasmid stability protein
MPTITLKNLPRDLHRDLKQRALAHHRSLNKEVIATLRAATGATTPLDAAELERAARQARANFKRPLTMREISGWKRQSGC